MGLSGRPLRHMGVLATSKFYDVRDNIFAFTPEVGEKAGGGGQPAVGGTGTQGIGEPCRCLGGACIFKWGGAGSRTWQFLPFFLEHSQSTA